MFAHVKEVEASKVDNPRPVDLSPECLSMMEKLMLAQAQVQQMICQCTLHSTVALLPASAGSNTFSLVGIYWALTSSWRQLEMHATLLTCPMHGVCCCACRSVFTTRHRWTRRAVPPWPNLPAKPAICMERCRHCSTHLLWCSTLSAAGWHTHR